MSNILNVVTKSLGDPGISQARLISILEDAKREDKEGLSKLLKNFYAIELSKGVPSSRYDLLKGYM